MAEPKTRPTDASVADFLAQAPRSSDAEEVDRLMRAATGEPAVLWGTNIVGYGLGPDGTWPLIGFAPRKTSLVLYLNNQLEDAYFENLGPHRRGVGCLYVKRLDDVDPEVLRGLIDRSLELAQAAPDVL